MDRGAAQGIAVDNVHPTGAPLRVLVAHNRYQQRGGEDSVAEAEVALLQSHGHPVALYTRDNHDIETMARVDAATQTFWSKRTTSDISRLIREFRPDVVHVHNTFPLISPSIYWTAHRHRVPIVQTLHNFRLVCPQALMLREDRPCEDCVGKLPWRGVQHACYRQSRLQTGLLAGMLTVHRAIGTWQDKVTRYIALNAFCRDRFIAGGLPADRLRIKPNFVDLPAPDDAPRSGFLFVGRLSAEKGIGVLADACNTAALTQAIRVAGTGPELDRIRQATGATLLGALAPDAVYAEMRKASALVLPSICYENFPRTLVEAYACGLPVIASRLGGMASLVIDGKTGLLFEPGNSRDLADKMAWFEQNPAAARAMGQAARAQYEQELTGAANYRQLKAIYDDAIAAVRSA